MSLLPWDVLCATATHRSSRLSLVMLFILLGMAAMVIDIGRAYFSYRELQDSTDAAALAGAQSLPLATAAVVATQYSSTAVGYNVHANLPNVTMATGYPMIRCLTTLKNEGMPCIAPALGNAITVRQQAPVPMLFASLIGHRTLTIVATATASMRGSSTTPSNVLIVVDSTASMNSLDADSNCVTTRIACALAGVQTLLNTLSPCGSSFTICGTVTSGNVVNAVDKVSLMTFPAVSSATAVNDYNCAGAAPAIVPYSYPTLPQYSIVPFSSDYKTSDSVTTLSSSSNIVAAVGAKSKCTGLQAIGGEGTYYAGVVYAAQAALNTASSAQIQNVMIILSDGDANATSAALPGASTTSGTYPSTLNQCAQAVSAAHAATAAGTRVYTIAYGATASGCATDKSGITPCQTMEQMASAPQYFYSDYTATGGSSTCVSASQPTTNLNQIFSAIANDFTGPRLIPDSTT